MKPQKRIHFIRILMILMIMVLSISLYPLAICGNEQGGLVLVTELNGVVGISMENYVQKVLDSAKDQGAMLVVFQLDTPGGLVSSMRAITNTIMDSPVPVLVWVSPRGARAASAGAFIVQSASIAAMSPGTNIGAAHPVQASGGDVPDEEMNKKITNDLAAQMRSLAQMHGRNSEICSKMVTESISLTAEEAKKDNVIDLLESELSSLLTKTDGMQIKVEGKERVFSLKGYEIVRMEMTPREKILQFISSPTVAYLLLMVGIYAIIFEVLSPGGFVMGVSGAVMVILGAYGLRMLPVNSAGIILLVVGIAVMVLDLFVGGIGILSLFGIAAMIFGSLIVFKAPGGELLNVSMNVIIGAVVAISLFFLLAIAFVLRTLRTKASSGQEGLVGKVAFTVEDLSPDGLVKCHGEIWKARSNSGEEIPVGTNTRVVKTQGLLLFVEVESSDDQQKGDVVK